MKHNPANNIQDLQYFGESGGVNPSISDSSTYTFLTAKAMSDTFEGNTDGCYLYSRHTSPSNLNLASALAAMENTASATVTASGMGAITPVLLQLCKTNEHIISSRTIYGGTYALLKNFFPRLAIHTSFVDITDIAAVEAAITPKTRVIYCEALSNPLLEVAPLEKLSALAKKHNLKLVVDNTFTPLSITPVHHGADVVIHSLTKFINGSSDTVGGVICGTEDFINSLKDVNDGACMLLGSTMDSMRSASILKNLRTLHLRIQKHSENALYLTNELQKLGLNVVYPGLENFKDKEVFESMLNSDFGYGGMFTLNLESLEKANALMELMQQKNIGYLAVSLGFYKTLFSAPGSSTSSEISEEEQQKMGLSNGLIRFSIGLDHDIKRTFAMIKSCLEELNIC
ncbi:MAG: aminotransferase class I/II-fold pyridoxal phosphate-dependent enzyme [Mesonia hippocampi]|uniref:aminotransferase class I/II-fold pyridoxal phosphate-dependent enzyme n=1 Tax=Mesonia hippocampi TaxID=1628250 RepID=UPI003F996F01